MIRVFVCSCLRALSYFQARLPGRVGKLGISQSDLSSQVLFVLILIVCQVRANTGEQPHQRVGPPVYIVNSVGIAGTALSVGEKFFSNTYNIVLGLFTGTSI